MLDEQLIGILAGVSVLTFIATLLIIPWVLIRLPSHYFVRDKRIPLGLPNHHTMMRVAFLIVKNLLGVVLLLGGIAMLVLPGQGLLTMLLGLSLIDFPGKFALERKIMRKKSVHRSINWIRRKAHKEPMEIPE